MGEGKSSLAMDQKLTPQERRQLLVEWNNTQAAYPSLCVHQLFEQQAQATPTAIALVHHEQQITYAELNQRANQLAHCLQQLNVQPDDLVAVYTERAPELIIALLAIFKAGGAYLPLDAAYPLDRLEYMFADSATRLLLTTTTLLERLPQFREITQRCPTLCLDQDWPQIAQYPLANPTSAVQPQHLAYCIYTSGSTGRPKGVLMEHHSLVNLLWWHRQARVVYPGMRTLQFCAISMDFSFHEIFAALCLGGTIVLIDEEVRNDPFALTRFIDEQKIEKLFLPVPVLSQIAQVAQHGPTPTSLRQVIASGDQLQITPAIADLFRKTGAQLHNHYGGTEFQDATVFTLQNDPARWPTLVPAGRPLHNVQIYLLDKAGALVPIGAEGELCIGGAGVARGYLNRPELNQQKFIRNPYGEGLLYRTGDAGRYLPAEADGFPNIEHLGRIDSMVKIRGYRIELGEIELALLAHPGVREAVVIAQENEGHKRLIAYIVARGNDPQNRQSLSAASLRDHLEARLPAYMTPAVFVQIDALPLTPSGKLDRNALPAPNNSNVALDTTYIAPQNSSEARLSAIWSAVLGLERIGVEDNFFALGGDSIVSLQIVARAHQAGLTFSTRQLFEAQTIRQLATLATENGQQSSGGALEAALLPPTAWPAGLEKANIEAVYPLSPLQQGMLFETIRSPQSGVYVTQLCLTLHGPLNQQAFRQAWATVLARYAVLRTGFVWEGMARPVQAVYQTLALPWVYFDWRTTADPQTQLQAFLAADRQQGFDLTQPPLMRCTLIQIADEAYQFVWSHHHILVDGWSLPLIEEAVFTAYEAATLPDEVSTQASGSPAVTPYVAYIAWLHQQDKARAKAFWQHELAGFTAPTPFNVDQPRGHLQPAAQPRSPYARQYVALPATLQSELETFAKRHQLTLNTLFLAAWALLLSRYSGNADVLFGVTVSGRPATLPDVDAIVGLFINTLPTRVQLADDMTVVPWLQMLQQQHLARDEYAHSALVDIHGWSELPRETPLFESLLAYENYPIHAAPALQRQSRVLDQTNYPLTVIVEPRPQLSLEFSYDPQRFTLDTIERMAGHFQTLLTNLVNNPAQAIKRAPMLTAAEEQQLLVAWNHAESDYPQDGCLHQRFETQVARTPDALAVSFGEQQLTYRELNERANQLAHHLRALGVGTSSGAETLVGLCVERSIETVVGILGILKAGGAYVPLDPTYPPERLAFMLQDAAAPVLLTQQALRDRLPATPAHILCLDSDWPQIAEQSPANIGASSSPDSLAYIIYTSGSTGTPKGVMVQHNNVLRLFAATEAWFRFKPSDVWTLFHSYAFDFSVWEIWGALLYGGRLVIIPYLISRSPEQFYQLLCEQGVTVLNQTPSAFRRLIHAESSLLAQPARPSERPPQALALRYVIFGGEALELASLQPWFARHGDQTPQLINMYGITETTVHVTYRPLRQADVSQPASLIGGPIPDLQLYILDSQQQPLPIGVPGELYVGGAGVSRGYLQRPALTAERFVSVDGLARYTKQRLYRTGDLVRRLPNGDIEYMGRIDNQVKIRGFRIELGEIETRLIQHPAVREAVVVARNAEQVDQSREKQLVAYVVLAEPCPAERLRQHLAAALPDYMIPALFIPLEALPLTDNGKVNYKALPESTQATPAVPASILPQTALEQQIATIWQQVLQVEQVGLHDNFFDLGGHSLALMRVYDLLKAQWPVKLSMQDLFSYPTIHTLAKYVSQLQRESAIVPAHDAAPEQGLATPDRIHERRSVHAQRRQRRQHPTPTA
ncbi:MAG: amino acid adenylation domain-containing protein [Caldilineaceae bacterium]